ncbi:MAG: hypothetical protein HW390_2076 [Candidatus Brocadiaceae bacterium]|nr:hypothetical protein [Candidatus Brocadiaceae bacterium]
MKYENFNDAEVLRIAVNMEEEGLVFYSSLAKSVKNAKVKEIFSILANEEKDHLNNFQKVYNEITTSRDAAQGCEDYTVDEYIRHLVETGVFTQKGEVKRLTAEIKTDLDALRIGIQAEKDAILFYSEAAKNTKNKEGQKAFEFLASEEKKHLKLLADLLRVLKK